MLTIRVLSGCADLPVVQNSLLTEPLTSPPPQQPKKKGGARTILLQPPVSLLFDDALAKEVEGSPKQPYIVSGRIAKTRFVCCIMAQAGSCKCILLCSCSSGSR